MKLNSKSYFRGSVLVWTVLTMAILSLFATEVLRAVSGRYQLAVQSAKWQESLLAAESGVDLGVVELRKSLYPAPNYAWKGWTNTPGNGVVSRGLATVPTQGLAATPMSIEVNVDAPVELKDKSTGWQYYRIRTLGTSELPGQPRSGFNKLDNRLRKLTLQSQRFVDNLFTGETSAPHAARRIEAILKPTSAFDQAILAIDSLNFNNQNIIIDSYDSRDDTKSTGGLYPKGDRNPDGSLKRQENGNIATDGTVLNVGQAYVHGDVSTNAGQASGIGNITGIERTDFYQDPIPIGAPNWSSINPSASLVNGLKTLTASEVEGDWSSRFVLTSISLTGNNSSQTLTLAGPTNADGTPKTKADGTPVDSYIEIHVTGEITVSGNGEIEVAPGVHATIYFDKSVDITGNGLVNSNNQPANLLLYGVQPDPNVTRTVKLAGNAELTAAVYAPGHVVEVRGGGSTSKSGNVFGSIVGKTVTMNGVTNLHYDEALSASGLINNYQIVSWFEDTR